MKINVFVKSKDIIRSKKKVHTTINRVINRVMRLKYYKSAYTAIKIYIVFKYTHHF